MSFFLNVLGKNVVRVGCVHVVEMYGRVHLGIARARCIEGPLDRMRCCRRYRERCAREGLVVSVSISVVERGSGQALLREYWDGEGDMVTCQKSGSVAGASFCIFKRTPQLHKLLPRLHGAPWCVIRRGSSWLEASAEDANLISHRIVSASRPQGEVHKRYEVRKVWLNMGQATAESGSEQGSARIPCASFQHGAHRDRSTDTLTERCCAELLFQLHKYRQLRSSTARPRIRRFPSILTMRQEASQLYR